MVAVPADRPALAPDPGAAKVTTTPPTGLLFASRTVACSAAENAVLAVAVCGVPAVAMTEAGAPAVFVRANVADSAPIEAVTL